MAAEADLAAQLSGWMCLVSPLAPPDTSAPRTTATLDGESIQLYQTSDLLLPRVQTNSYGSKARELWAPARMRAEIELELNWKFCSRIGTERERESWFKRVT